MNLGKKVKVRDMKPGWTYRVPGKTLEEIYESAHEYAKWPPVQMTDAKQNTGLLLLKVTEDNKNNWDEKYGFNLYPIHEEVELTEKALRPGQQGTFQVVRTGNKVWNYHPNCIVRVEVDSLDFEMEEAYPFPIAVVRDDYEPIPLPNPWTWGETSDPDSKAAKHVDVWDESDAKTIVILGIISFVLLMAGLSGLSLLITMWAVAAAYFHSKHEKVRKEILEQRNKHGISGSGLDHKFRW
ncbi:hypothetical protein DW958_04730 [Ruminococcus sp. AM46-18]|nr:hypothetical protein DW958_04730 [Ruminococcus sp. AM46-18]